MSTVGWSVLTGRGGGLRALSFFMPLTKEPQLMWTNFEACNDAVPASSQEDFELNVLKYLKDQPGLAGLLRYMPAGMLVRILGP